MSLYWWKTWSEDLAYVLGFAFADGGIGKNRNSLTLAQSDKTILELISSRVPNGQMTYSSGAKVWRLRFCEDGLNSLLAEYGIIPNKTVYGYWPLHIPNEFVRHYVRGFFDGDGHVSVGYSGVFRPTVMFVIHQKQYAERVKAELESLEVFGGLMAKDGNNFRLRYHRFAELIRLHIVLYESSTLYMERKKAVFDALVERAKTPVSIQGSNHGNAMLDESDILEIRRLYSEGNKTQKEIGNLYGVNHRTISLIVRGEAWRHVE
jgi:hypothetical protein